ncbi:DUF2087 domain-containing protein [Verminephrobacter aporrectodeae subsp. tuberculatae]|uniref:class I SAM-dependent methyltransferase n=1 Tax=Verminephrobacter aporrectodeae TaxID=1110389 RepID=UPI002238FBE0|nr:class I SAM-dependent methyltransferase [Verminephrobacter aporrectodeae]MCW5258402.1 DUF2087 domain-containing protein [Verminephrobacter aporrectodeae subsp. tuberculatae]
MNIIRPGMGTENSSALLSTLIRMSRPKTVVEIGAGDSTIFLASALKHAQSDWKRDKELGLSPNWEERTALIDPVGIPDNYQPVLITIDDFRAEGQSAEDAWGRLAAAGIEDRFVTFVQEDFFSLDASTLNAWGPIDFAWIDAGTPADDVRFVSVLWDRIAPGGHLCLHDPIMTTTVKVDGSHFVRKVRSPVWEELVYRFDGSYDLLTVPENHKYRQTGIGIIRKRTASELVVRYKSLQAELFELGEIPIRNDYMKVAKDALRQRNLRDAISTAMSSSVTRSVYAAVVLGASSVSDIASKVGADLKCVSKIVSRLQSMGLIARNEHGLHESETIWAQISNTNQRDSTNLNDRQLEEKATMEAISNAFRFGTSYTEAEVSNICKLFTDDYARLRRFLVDNKVLKKTQSVFSLASCR